MRADEHDLWPELAPAHAAVQPGEVVAVYPHRWAVPRETWHRLFGNARREIAILACSGLFLAEDAGLISVLPARASAGVDIRIALGDPDSPRAAERGTPEGTGDAMAAKIRNALALYRPLRDAGHAEIRLHRTVLYNSIYRADDEMLVNGPLRSPASRLDLGVLAVPGPGGAARGWRGRSPGPAAVGP